MLTINRNAHGEETLIIDDPAANGLGISEAILDGLYQEGSIKCRSYKVEDLTVCLGEAATEQELEIIWGIHSSCYISMYVIDGGLTGSYKGNKIVLGKDSYLSVLVGKATSVTVALEGNAQIFAAVLSGKAAAKMFTNQEKARLKSKVSEEGLPLINAVSDRMNAALQSLVAHIESGDLHQILLTAKTLELIFLDVNQNSAESQESKTSTFRPEDIQKLENAKAIIRDNLKAPYSLIELAHKVGLNDFKLKKGFREVFGTTVFGHLADLRMQEAKRLLIIGNVTIAEVAHRVGFKNPHHFTAAFKKKFGHVPSKVG